MLSIKAVYMTSSNKEYSLIIQNVRTGLTDTEIKNALLSIADSGVVEPAGKLVSLLSAEIIEAEEVIIF